MNRTILTASEGKILTDGVVYGTIIYLAENRSESEFYEITMEEYEQKMLEEMEAIEPDHEENSEMAEKAQAYDIITGVSE